MGTYAIRNHVSFGEHQITCVQCAAYVFMLAFKLPYRH